MNIIYLYMRSINLDVIQIKFITIASQSVEKLDFRRAKIEILPFISLLHPIVSDNSAHLIEVYHTIMLVIEYD